MAIPEQIRKQTEAVQQLYQQLNPDDNTGGTTSADGTVTPVENRDNTPLADANSAPNNAAPSSANEHKSDDDNLPEETIVQKYKTLQGMYNAEVPQIVEKIVTDKDVEEYGESLDVMRKVSREELLPMEQRFAQMEQMFKQMQTNVVPQVQAVVQRQQVSAEQGFWAELTSVVPNFRQINDNDAFQSWLLAADPLTGITRQTYLDDAQRSLDAKRVANFFRAWLESTGQATVAQSTGRAQNSELEKQVTPGRSRNTGTPASANQGKMYSPQDIQKFFNDVRTGKYKGREPERDRIERDIFAAQRENRIQVNA